MILGFLASTTVYVVELRYEYSHLVAPIMSLGCSAIGLSFIAILAYVVRIKLRTDTYREDSPVKRAGISWLLRYATELVVLSGLIAIIFADNAPSPDLRTDPTTWGWAYRTAVSLPGVFYTFAAAVIFARGSEHSAHSFTKNQRWPYAAWGSFGFGLFWVNLWIWPHIPLYPAIGWASAHATGLQRLLEAPIFAFFGLAYARAFLPRYRSGTVDQRLSAAMESQSVSDNICARLFGPCGVNPEIMDNGLEQLNILYRVGAKIRLGNTEQQLTRYALLIYAGYRRGFIEFESITYLDTLARRQLAIGTEPGGVPRAVGPVLKLVDPSQPTQHFLSDDSLYEPWTLVFLVFAYEHFNDVEAHKQLTYNQSHFVNLIRWYRSHSRRELYGYSEPKLDLPAS